jgi:hypothetical protein
VRSSAYGSRFRVQGLESETGKVRVFDNIGREDLRS